MDISDLTDAFHAQLKDMYSVEKQLADAMPKMVNQASNPKLVEALQHHMQVTQRQMERVRQMLDDMGVNPGNTKCVGMDAIIKEASELASKSSNSDARDAAIICGVQKAEHYEIATYGTLRTWAKLLEMDEAVDTLEELLDQEYAADNALDEVAQAYVNERAAS